MGHNQQAQSEYIEIDLVEVFREIKERLLVVILCGIIGAGIMGVYSFVLATPIYEATSKMYVLTQSTSITSLADIQLSSSLALDYEEMITCRPVINSVKKNLGLDYTYKQLVEMIDIENPSSTRVLNISVQSADAEEAAEIANEVAMVSKESISNIMDTDAPKVFQKAIVPGNPIKPEKKKLIALGFIMGAFLAAAAITVKVAVNDRLRKIEDIERVLGITVLAAIPYEGAISDQGDVKDKKKKKAKKGNRKTEKNGARRA